MPFVFDIGRATLTEVDADGFIGVQVDLYGEEKASTPALEMHAPYGFWSRPRDPDVGADGNPTAGCNVLYAWEGSTGHAWPLTDPRTVENLPPLLKGESIMFGGSGINFVRMHADGAMSFFTTSDNTIAGQAVGMRIAPDGWTFTAPWGTFRFDANGFHVRDRSGARLDMGAIGGMPPPLDALGSYATLEAAMVQLSGNASSARDMSLRAWNATTLLTWITTVLIPALAIGNSGGPIVVIPPLVPPPV